MECFANCSFHSRLASLLRYRLFATWFMVYTPTIKKIYFTSKQGRRIHIALRFRTILQRGQRITATKIAIRGSDQTLHLLSRQLRTACFQNPHTTGLTE
jgi:hypothetical protein